MGICCGIAHSEPIQLLDSPDKTNHKETFQINSSNQNLNNDVSILVSSYNEDVQYQVRYKGTCSNHK